MAAPLDSQADTLPGAVGERQDAWALHMSRVRANEPQHECCICKDCPYVATYLFFFCQWYSLLHGVFRLWYSVFFYSLFFFRQWYSVLFQMCCIPTHSYDLFLYTYFYQEDCDPTGIDVITMEPCGHQVHQQCILPWMESQGTELQQSCPMRCNRPAPARLGDRGFSPPEEIVDSPVLEEIGVAAVAEEEEPLRPLVFAPPVPPPVGHMGGGGGSPPAQRRRVAVSTAKTVSIPRRQAPGADAANFFASFPPIPTVARRVSPKAVAAEAAAKAKAVAKAKPKASADALSKAKASAAAAAKAASKARGTPP